MLGDEQRLEAAIAVAWHVDAHRTILGQYGLGGAAVAQVGALLGPGLAVGVSEVMRQFGTKRPLDERALEGQGDVFDRLGGHRTGNELLDQFLGDGRQLPLGRSGRVALALH